MAEARRWMNDGDWGVFLVAPDGVTVKLDSIEWGAPGSGLLTPRDAAVAVALVRHSLGELERAHPAATAQPRQGGEP